MNTPNNTSSNRKIGIATAVALAAGALILVAVVLPAEFGIDPLRTGQLLGLTEMSQSPSEANTEMHQDHSIDTIELVLEPFQSVEYKFHMDEGAALVYSWRANGELYFDFHGEHSGIEDYEESFDSGDASERRGTFVAPYPGVHGWFWENRSFEEVTLRLHASGFTTQATEYRDGGTADRTLRSVFD